MPLGRTSRTAAAVPCLAGALRALFVTPTRLADMPDVPSAAETGFPDMNKIVGWTALMGPPGLPKEVVDRWTEVFAKLADAWDDEGNAYVQAVVDAEDELDESFIVLVAGRA